MGTSSWKHFLPASLNMAFLRCLKKNNLPASRNWFCKFKLLHSPSIWAFPVTDYGGNWVGDWGSPNLCPAFFLFFLFSAPSSYVSCSSPLLLFLHHFVIINTICEYKYTIRYSARPPSCPPPSPLSFSDLFQVFSWVQEATLIPGLPSLAWGLCSVLLYTTVNSEQVTLP